MESGSYFSTTLPFAGRETHTFAKPSGRSSQLLSTITGSAVWRQKTEHETPHSLAHGADTGTQRPALSHWWHGSDTSLPGLSRAGRLGSKDWLPLRLKIPSMTASIPRNMLPCNWRTVGLREDTTSSASRPLLPLHSRSGGWRQQLLWHSTLSATGLQFTAEPGHQATIGPTVPIPSNAT